MVRRETDEQTKDPISEDRAPVADNQNSLSAGLLWTTPRPRLAAVPNAHTSSVSESRHNKADQVGSQELDRRWTLHRFFELGILIKGIDGGLELIGGLLLLFLTPAAIAGILFFFIKGELKEDPTDLIANLLLHTTRQVVQAKLPASMFLIVHGAVKLLLVAGLAANKLWSYPTAIAVFAGFTIYQIFQLWHQSSLFLGTVTLLDLVVVLLVFGEYRQVTMANSPCAIRTS